MSEGRATGLATTIISLLLCVPLVYGFNLLTARLIGKRKRFQDPVPTF
ncbi:MAG: hypothetical protein KJO60_09180 [Desulfofustis sp.]|nr:hypothetical protein [Desulfofustis sp.]MBT8354683.1 hypothetical protein [Desulfofustis sp.]NNF45174.1 hypothetical protein [Desulfofustis sp.]NNK58281.1 hypothetical protein [Desulfofustis sp.]